MCVVRLRGGVDHLSGPRGRLVNEVPASKRGGRPRRGLHAKRTGVSPIKCIKRKTFTTENNDTPNAILDLKQPSTVIDEMYILYMNVTIN